MLKPLGDRVALKIEEKNKLLEVLSRRFSPRKTKTAWLWLLDKVFVLER